MKKKKRKRGKGKNGASEGGDTNAERSSIVKVEPDLSLNRVDKPETRSDDLKSIPKKKKRKTAGNGQSYESQKADQSEAKTNDEGTGSSGPRKNKVEKVKVEENRNDVQTENSKNTKIPVINEQSNSISREANKTKESSNNGRKKSRKNNGKGKTLEKDVKKKDKNKMTHNKVAKLKKNIITDLSSERLKAYGINPKKFRNKLKYGNKS